MKRILLDILVLALFLAVMSFHALPKSLHEVLGLLFPLGALVHLTLNRRWFSALRSGKWDVMRCMSALVNLLLVASLIIIAATGICMSNYLFKGMIPLALNRNMMLHQLHVSLPFAMMILMGIHLGFHWQGWKQRLIRFFRWQEESFAYLLGSRIVIIVLIGVGIYGSFQNRVLDRLLMKHIFATPATGLPGAAYALLLLSIFFIYVFGGHGIQLICQRHGNRKQQKKSV